MKSLFYFLTSFLFILSQSFSNVTSTKGVIDFDRNNDQIPDMSLNSSGLGIGTTSSLSTLEFNGTLGWNYEIVSSNLTLGNNTMILADTASDNLFLSLPTASSVTGRTYMIKKKSRENQLWISASDNIDGENSDYLLEGLGSRGQPYIWFYSDGSEWLVTNLSNDVDWVVASENLVAWWKFDETTGIVADDVGVNHFDADLQGGFSFSGCTQSGVDGKSLVFDGVDDYATISSDLNNQFYEEITVSVWVYAEGSSFAGAHTAFMTEAYSGDGRVTFQISGDFPGGSSTQVGIGFYSSGWKSLNQSGSFNFGQWVHVVGTYDGAFLKLYIDGTLNNSKAEATALPIGLEEWRVGRRHDNNDYFQGKLDDLRIYNTALTDEQVETLYLQNR